MHLYSIGVVINVSSDMLYGSNVLSRGSNENPRSHEGASHLQFVEKFCDSGQVIKDDDNH